MLHILCCGFTTEIRRVMVDRSPMMLGEFKKKLFFQSSWEDYPKTPTDRCLDCLGWREIATALKDARVVSSHISKITAQLAVGFCLCRTSDLSIPKDGIGGTPNTQHVSDPDPS